MRVLARTVDLLGRQQIATVQNAVVELFKNAYDAGASYIRVDYCEHFCADETDLISIRDDGEGMSYEDFLKIFGYIVGGHFWSTSIQVGEYTLTNAGSTSFSDGMVFKMTPIWGAAEQSELEVKNVRKEYKITTDIEEIDGIKGGNITGEDKRPSPEDARQQGTCIRLRRKETPRCPQERF